MAWVALMRVSCEGSIEAQTQAKTQLTLAAESRRPGKYQTMMRPWQSTRVVGREKEPRVGVGNADMSLLSARAGSRGALTGTRRATEASAKVATSQGTVTGVG